MKGVLSDLRHAFRVDLATPYSTALAVCLLGLGLGLASVFVSMWNDLNLRPQPGFTDGARLVSLMQVAGEETSGLPLRVIKDLDESATTLAGVAGVHSDTRKVRIADDTRPAAIEFVTGAFFPKLKPQLLFGRPLDERDHFADSDPVVILSYDFWQREFSGRDNVLGEIGRAHV